MTEEPVLPARGAAFSGAGSSPRQTGRPWLWIALAWLSAAAIWTPAVLLADQPPPWSVREVITTYVQMVVHFAPWLLALPLFIRLGARWPIGMSGGLKHVAYYALLGLVMAPCFTLVSILVNRGIGLLEGTPWPENPVTALLQASVITGLFAVPTYVAVAAVGQMLAYLRRYREREQLLAAARIRALRAELTPHFLFNALNAIAGLIHQDPQKADEAVVRLSTLLRAALDRPQWATVQDEAAYLRDYAALHHLLLGDRLRFDLVIGAGAGEVALPALITQPLVENALRHGIAKLTRPGTVTVHFNPKPGGLEIRVTNSALKNDRPWRAGVGLANVRDRIAATHGPQARLEIDQQQGEVETRLWLPDITGGRS